MREFRNTAPPYRNFLTRVRRVISHERGRLAMGIVDDVSYESGVSQLNELASRVLVEAQALVLGAEHEIPPSRLEG
jgi:hypothetical protein